MVEEIKKITIGSILFCCCFGILFMVFGILSELAGSGLAYEIGRALGFMIGFTGVFFVMVLDAIFERRKNNKRLRKEILGVNPEIYGRKTSKKLIKYINKTPIEKIEIPELEKIMNEGEKN